MLTCAAACNVPGLQCTHPAKRANTAAHRGLLHACDPGAGARRGASEGAEAEPQPEGRGRGRGGVRARGPRGRRGGRGARRGRAEVGGGWGVEVFEK